MGIEALGYIGVRAKTLDDWASYGEKLLGLQRIDKSRSGLAFRMDDRKQPTAARVSPSLAGRSRTPPLSTRSRHASRRLAPRSRAARARSPASGTLPT